ncbi:TolC family protein [Parabacteroides pacaensis]|uniref:TolC family protein n=1 Tax=Parabacteroides pacaensis TaxID=2086575 RepID=UPI000D107D25|nr:TolC family protein [Parabacteroides pacaensis]
MRKNLIYIFSLVGTLSLSAQESLTITEYKQRVLEYSQQIKQSSEQRKSMVEAVKAVKTGFFPQIDFSGSYQYRINDYTMNFGEFPISMDPNTYSLEATVAQNVYDGGATYNRYKATQIQRDIAEQSELLTTDNVIRSADVTYWSASAQKKMYEVMTQYVEIIKSQRNLLAERFNDGLISKTDLLQIEARLKDAELQRITSYKSYKIALQNLNILMGNEPSTPVIIVDSISTYQVLPLPIHGDQALSNRPEYSIANLNIDYQQRQINLTRSKYNPKLAVGFKETWGTQMLNIDGSTMWNSALYASVSIPIFHWGARFKEVNSQKALLRSQEFARQITIDQISQEVSNAWTNLTENTKQIQVAEASVQIAEENLDLNTFSYNEGKLPILDVLSAQLTWIQSYSNLIQSWLQQKVSLADYYKAVGIRK